MRSSLVARDVPNVDDELMIMTEKNLVGLFLARDVNHIGKKKCVSFIGLSLNKKITFCLAIFVICWFGLFFVCSCFV